VEFFPYLSFNGNCREALTFYAEVLGGTVESFTQWQEAMIADLPGASTDHIMHGSVLVGSARIAGSDQFGDMYSPAGNISVMIDIDDLDKAEAIFAALANDGQVIMPFGETFWAAGYGYCTDRFGILWQVNSTGDKA
jgi:PhnB protein